MASETFGQFGALIGHFFAAEPVVEHFVES
jgi:hypothetical protein